MDRSGKAFHVKYSGDWRKMSQDSYEAMIKSTHHLKRETLYFLVSIKYLVICKQSLDK